MGDKKVTLKLEKVSKSFAKIETDEVTHALNEIDLTLNSGEFISLVGPSGCGKSTILRLVAGLIVPTKGTVSVDGKEVKEPSPERGMVFQKPTLFPWLTVEKNIAFSLRMQGKLKGNEDKVKRMIDVIGLEAFKDDYPDQLSGGMACNKCPYVKGTLYTLLLLSSIFRAIITFPIYVYQMLQNLDASSRFMIDERKLGLLFWNTFRLSKKAALFSVFISEKVASSF